MAGAARARPRHPPRRAHRTRPRARGARGGGPRAGAGRALVGFEGRLPGAVEAAAYYVVSEALTNVAKYAAAGVVRIRIERVDGSARIAVSDDGAGGADPSGGSGLRGLADRVEALGGRLTIDSPPGAGTTLRADIPLS